MSNPNTRMVKLNLDILGRGTVEVDGQEMQNLIRGVRLDAYAGELTQVALMADSAIEFEGEAEVVVLQAGLTAEFLQELDPSALHEAASALPWGNSKELVANVLTVLEGMIRDARKLEGG